jgi:hypothetical protein
VTPARDFTDAWAAYADGRPRDLGDHGQLDPAGEITWDNDERRPMTAGPGWIEASADVVVAERRLIRAALRVAEHDFAPTDQSSEGDYQLSPRGHGLHAPRFDTALTSGGVNEHHQQDHRG